MFDIFLAPENLVFAVAAVVMLAIAGLEILSGLAGMGLSGLVDNLMPEFDIDADGEIDTVPALSRVLGWLQFGRLPALVVLLLFLCLFSLGGFALQALVHDVVGSYLSAGVAWLPALAAAVPGLHFVGDALARIMPRDETEAVNADAFVGETATITLGTARAGHPAQARLTDAFGKTHYVMVEPEVEGEFAAGSEVRLTGRNNGTFSARAARGQS